MISTNPAQAKAMRGALTRIKTILTIVTNKKAMFLAYTEYFDFTCDWNQKSIESNA